MSPFLRGLFKGEDYSFISPETSPTPGTCQIQCLVKHDGFRSPKEGYSNYRGRLTLNWILRLPWSAPAWRPFKWVMSVSMKQSIGVGSTQPLFIQTTHFLIFVFSFSPCLTLSSSPGLQPDKWAIFSGCHSTQTGLPRSLPWIYGLSHDDGTCENLVDWHFIFPLSIFPKRSSRLKYQTPKT